MTTNKKEYLSALLDGESGQFEQRRLTQEIYENNDIKQLFSNYALIGELVRGNQQHSSIASNHFLTNLNQQLDLEEPFSHTIEDTALPLKKPPALTQERKIQPFIGFALVASIAAMATLGVQTLTTASLQNNQALPLLSDTRPTSSQTSDNNLSTIVSATQNEQWEYDPEMQAQLRLYVNQHSQYSSVTGIMHTVRAASYNAGY